MTQTSPLPPLTHTRKVSHSYLINLKNGPDDSKSADPTSVQSEYNKSTCNGIVSDFSSYCQIQLLMDSLNFRQSTQNKFSLAPGIYGVLTPNCIMPYSETYDIYDYIFMCYENDEMSYYDLSSVQRRLEIPRKRQFCMYCTCICVRATGTSFCKPC